MSWLSIIQLAATLIQQALIAFSHGQLKESVAVVHLETEHAATVEHIAKQVGVV